MCFSATASFVSSAILGVIGIAAFKKIEKGEQKVFALIPIIFAIQQFVEGFVWISFNTTGNLYWQQFLIKTFLFFALVVWPVWVPFSVWKFEESRSRKWILFFFLTVGLVFAGVSFWFLLTSSPSAIVENYHIHYTFNFPIETSSFAIILYLVATILSLLISSKKLVPLLGTLIFLSYAVTRFYYKDETVSVWCFFAAIISTLIYKIVSNRESIGEPSPVSSGRLKP